MHVCNTFSNNKYRLNFNHPCKELVWVVQRDDVVKLGYNQWTNYMERVIEIVCVNNRNELSNIPIHSHRECPFRFSDLPLPTCNTGFVYMLISICDMSYSYIGQTININTRLNQHNSGYGTTFTDEQHDLLVKRFGLDKSLFEQYTLFLVNTLV